MYRMQNCQVIMYVLKLVNEMGAFGFSLGASGCWKLVSESSRVNTSLHDHEIISKNIHFLPPYGSITLNFYSG